MHENIICLDPSCFTSLEKLRDTKHFLDEICNDNKFLKVYIPTEINKTINLLPEMKFQKLPLIIEDWIVKDDPDNISTMIQIAKNDYVNIMREILYLHNPKPVDQLVGNIKKTGTNSLHLDDLITKFGESKGKILFEIAAISNEYQARIIAFGEKTASLFSTIGTKILKGISNLKKEIKTKARIRTPLNIMMYFFVPAEPIYKFIEEFQIQGIEGLLLDPKIVTPLGWFLIANS